MTANAGGPTMNRQPITTPYDPEKVIGEWGWLWDEDAECEGAWVLVATHDRQRGETHDERLEHASTRDESDQDENLLVSMWDADGIRNDPIAELPAEEFRGQPYLPLLRPGCGPRAGLLVTVRLPEGASIGYSSEEPGENADHTRAQVLAAIGGTIGGGAA